MNMYTCYYAQLGFVAVGGADQKTRPSTFCLTQTYEEFVSINQDVMIPSMQSHVEITNERLSNWPEPDGFNAVNYQESRRGCHKQAFLIRYHSKDMVGWSLGKHQPTKQPASTQCW